MDKIQKLNHLIFSKVKSLFKKHNLKVFGYSVSTNIYNIFWLTLT